MSELGFGMDFWVFIFFVKGDLRKDGIGRCVFRIKKIWVERGELVKLDKIGMGIGICIDVLDWLMFLGWCDVFY